MINSMNKVKWRVLVFPGGTENGLEVHRALRYCKEVKLFSVSSSVSNHAPFVYDTNHVIGDVRGDAWVDELNRLVLENQIDFIFPTNAYVIDGLIRERNRIAARIVLSDSDVIQTTRSKTKTAAMFRDIISVPRSYRDPSEVDSFPVFIKPDNAYGAQGALRSDNKVHLDEVLRQSPEVLIQEFLPGREYSVDCFSTRKGQLLFCEGRERVRIRMGTTFSGVLAGESFNKTFRHIGEQILARLPLRGAWFFQMKENHRGELCLLEIEARIAGTMALNRVRGVNFPLLSLYDFADSDVSLSVNNYSVSIDRALLNRYRHSVEFDVVYVDLDDTIVVKNRLNTELVRFLYQCVNQNKRIVLISKSLEKDPMAYLRRWRIDGLFDEIHWLREEESKSLYIKDRKSIFIDDSFSERAEVHKVHRIPTFDGSMIEMLISDRE